MELALFLMCIYFRPIDIFGQKVKGQKKDILYNQDQKKAEGAILISDKIDLMSKFVKIDKEGYFVMIKC